MPSFLIRTLGCKLNQLESEAIIDAFLRAGFEEYEMRDEPSVIVINTCTVTSKADQKARGVISKALRDYPESCVVVTGCYAQLNKDDILGLEASGKKCLFVIKKDEIINLLQRYKNESGTGNDKLLIKNYFKTFFDSYLYDTPHSSFHSSGLFQFNPENFSQHTRSFLKIQDGCDKCCTYCRIRLARGPSISLEKEEVLSRLHSLEANHAEAVLTGVNICQYKDLGKEQKTGIELAGLLEYLLEGTEKIAIRLSSLSPQSVDESLARVLSHPRVRPHFHLSVQSCSKKILERMGRSYDSETIEKAAFFLRSAKDDPFLACDIITGFPGETESDFNQTVRLCRKLDFAWCHVFPFSKRSGTPAFSFSDTITEYEKTRRAQILTDLAKQGKADYIRRWIGREVDVLIEDSKHPEHEFLMNDKQLGGFGVKMAQGTSENYLKILVRCKGERTPLPGTVLRCKIIKDGNIKNIDVYADFY
ncbi:MAG: tRNA (N(6)-L-threonylcarbamoyladenosine(37)-C(2))-methylthiotransferase MtaB [Treponema sp.]|jgi:threonylcarbamoyladenosine tRNA methylthiotransferase MtaB|nr:tRNA (N(6)-L-threonylcarbamoyladenosine(37)-C(2))-methylthiotransferase MtaB [Treponema sp.]